MKQRLLRPLRSGKPPPPVQQLDDYRADRARFLPTQWDDLKARGWDRDATPLDFVFVTGDAYVDHPSFGTALLSRLLEAEGYRVGIIAQPRWDSAADFARLGRPHLAFLVTAGNMDSMVANYTVAGKPRREDAYSPGGIGGRRPDRAGLVYCTRIREAFKHVDIIVGGIEASLRRFAHYDYWSNRLRRSYLPDSKADLLVYGMAERSLPTIARRLAAGERAAAITDVPGTSVMAADDTIAGPADQRSQRREPPQRRVIDLPSWDELNAPDGRQAYARSFREQHRNTDALNADFLVERYGNRSVFQNPPAAALTSEELDRVYDLPYTRTFHPDYHEQGGVPAIEEVRFSLVGSRGCFGGCSFCALTFHQGRRIQTRSHAAVVREARGLVELPGFKGYIHDIGGPTANFHQPSCERQLVHGVCKDRQCLYPKPCRYLQVDHREYGRLLQTVEAIPGVKKVFIRSGIRFDYLMLDHNRQFLEQICRHHVSGRLKVAPEHTAPAALAAMGKPGNDVYDAFAAEFRRVNVKEGCRLQLIPYYISSHPGTTLTDAVALAEAFRDGGMTPEQVQDFYPTPGTVSTCMYYTGIDPRTMEPIPTATSHRGKAMQRALLQYHDPKNARLVRLALEEAGRSDLIGDGPRCLVAAENAVGRDRRGAKQRATPRSSTGRLPPARSAPAAPPNAHPSAGGQRPSRPARRRRDGR